MKTSPKDAAELMSSDLEQLRSAASQEERVIYLIANANLITFFLQHLKEQFTQDDLNKLEEKHSLNLPGEVSMFIFKDRFQSILELIDVSVERQEQTIRLLAAAHMNRVGDDTLKNLKRTIQLVQYRPTFSVEEVELRLHPAQSLSVFQ